MGLSIYALILLCLQEIEITGVLGLGYSSEYWFIHMIQVLCDEIWFCNAEKMYYCVLNILLSYINLDFKQFLKLHWKCNTHHAINISYTQCSVSSTSPSHGPKAKRSRWELGMEQARGRRGRGIRGPYTNNRVPTYRRSRSRSRSRSKSFSRSRSRSRSPPNRRKGRHYRKRYSQVLRHKNTK